MSRVINNVKPLMINIIKLLQKRGKKLQKKL